MSSQRKLFDKFQSLNPRSFRCIYPNEALLVVQRHHDVLFHKIWIASEIVLCVSQESRTQNPSFPCTWESPGEIFWWKSQLHLLVVLSIKKASLTWMILTFWINPHWTGSFHSNWSEDNHLIRHHQSVFQSLFFRKIQAGFGSFNPFWFLCFWRVWYPSSCGTLKTERIS